MLLDQEGFECDPISRRDGDTPLHTAVRWANELSQDQKEDGVVLIDMMLEAGSDAR
jgi:ankyrin repeat protein